MRIGPHSDKWLAEALAGLETLVTERFSRQSGASLTCHVGPFTITLSRPSPHSLAQRLEVEEQGAKGTILRLDAGPYQEGKAITAGQATYRVAVCDGHAWYVRLQAARDAQCTAQGS